MVNSLKVAGRNGRSTARARWFSITNFHLQLPRCEWKYVVSGQVCAFYTYMHSDRCRLMFSYIDQLRYLSTGRAVGSRWILLSILQQRRQSTLHIEEERAIKNDTQLRNLRVTGGRGIVELRRIAMVAEFNEDCALQQGCNNNNIRAQSSTPTFPCRILRRRTCSKESRSQLATFIAPIPPAEDPTSTTVEFWLLVSMIAAMASLETAASTTRKSIPQKRMWPLT